MPGKSHTSPTAESSYPCWRRARTQSCGKNSPRLFICRPRTRPCNIRYWQVTPLEGSGAGTSFRRLLAACWTTSCIVGIGNMVGIMTKAFRSGGLGLAGPNHVSPTFLPPRVCLRYNNERRCDRPPYCAGPENDTSRAPPSRHLCPI